MRRSARSRTGRRPCPRRSRSRRSSTCASGATSARVSFVATPTPQLDVTAGVHDAAARRRAAVGRQLRVQQRRRGGAAVRLAHQRLHPRRRVDERPQHAARRLQRLVVRQPRRHAGLGQPAAARRLDERAGPRPDGAVAVELGADRQRRRLHEVRAAHAAHRLRLVRLLEQRRAAAAVHDQLGAAAARAAARHARRPRRASSRRTSISCRVRRPTGASAPALRHYDYDNQTPHTAIPQFINYDTSVTDVDDRRARALRAQPHDVRRRRDLDRAARRSR